jgi:hypothetical protein
LSDDYQDEAASSLNRRLKGTLVRDYRAAQVHIVPDILTLGKKVGWLARLHGLMLISNSGTWLEPHGRKDLRVNCFNKNYQMKQTIQTLPLAGMSLSRLSKPSDGSS